jgi:hypothetical protein
MAPIIILQIRRHDVVVPCFTSDNQGVYQNAKAELPCQSSLDLSEGDSGHRLRDHLYVFRQRAYWVRASYVNRKMSPSDRETVITVFAHRLV